MRRRLEQVQIPGEHEAAERAWHVVRSAYAEYEPRPPARRPLALVIGLAVTAVASLVVVAVSPAGPALVRSVRHAVGSEHAERALVALPAEGRLLVDSGTGSWIVAADGSKRLLGKYATSSWSPHGLFEIVARGHELAALDPKGNVRWSIERPGTIRDPRWSPDGYRVAYRAGKTFRVIAGDGTGDKLLDAHVAPVAPAWRPGVRHVLAYVTAAGAVRQVDVDTGVQLALRRSRTPPELLRWSPDGSRLRVVSDGLDGAWAPDAVRFAIVRYDGAHDRSSVSIGSRVIFQGTGRIDSVNWSPDGRWLLLAWRTADQWIFARTSGRPRIRAVGSISSQFHSRTFPRLAGWCC